MPFRPIQLIALCLWLAWPTYAALVHCPPALGKMGQTGIEMETEEDRYFTLSQAAIEHTETTTGTLAPLLAGYALPAPLAKHLADTKQDKLSREQIMAIRWKSLPGDLRVKILDDLHAQKLAHADSVGEVLPTMSWRTVVAVKALIPALAHLEDHEAYEKFLKMKASEIPPEALAALVSRDPHAFLASISFTGAVGEMIAPYYLPEEAKHTAAYQRCEGYLKLQDTGAVEPGLMKDLPPQLQADFIEVIGIAGIRQIQLGDARRAVGFRLEALQIPETDHVSDAFQAWKKKRTAEGKDWQRGDIKDVPKDVLADVIRHYGVGKLLKFRVFQRQTQEWGYDRAIYGLLPPANLIVDFTETTELFGKTYPPGKHRVVTKGLFDPVVENLGATAPASRGVELKLRAGKVQGMTSSQVVEHTWKLQKLMGLAPTSLHAHTVEEMPKAANLPAALELERRLGLIEAFRFVEQGDPVVHTKTFGPPRPAVYGPRVQSVLKGPKQEAAWIPVQKGHVDLRGPDVYGIGDSGRPNIGFDFRTVSPGPHFAELAPVMDRAQAVMKQPDFGIDTQGLTQWHAEKYGADKPWDQAFTDLLWNRELPDLVAALPPSLRNAMNADLQKRFQTHFADLRRGQVTNHLELKLLLQDWGRDPVLRGKADVVKKIEAAQLKAFGRLKQDHDAVDVVREFLQTTELRKIMTESFGAKYVKVEPPK